MSKWKERWEQLREGSDRAYIIARCSPGAKKVLNGVLVAMTCLALTVTFITTYTPPSAEATPGEKKYHNGIVTTYALDEYHVGCSNVTVLCQDGVIMMVHTYCDGKTSAITSQPPSRNSTCDKR